MSFLEISDLPTALFEEMLRDIPTARLVSTAWRAAFDQGVKQLSPRGVVCFSSQRGPLAALLGNSFRNVHSLDLMHVGCCDDVLAVLRDLHASSSLRLHSLKLQCAKTHEVGCTLSRHGRHCGGSITNTGLRALARIISLRTLSLRRCPHITDDGVTSFCRLRDLQSLTLASCPSISFRNALSGLRLKHLNLDFCTRLSDDALGLIACAQPALLSLNLTWCFRLKHAGLRALATHTTALTTLSLAKCWDVDDDALQAVGNTLSLTNLDLSKVRRVLPPPLNPPEPKSTQHLTSVYPFTGLQGDQHGTPTAAAAEPAHSQSRRLPAGQLCGGGDARTPSRPLAHRPQPDHDLRRGCR